MPQTKIKVTRGNFAHNGWEAKHWDEWLKGDRVVYDSSYELNEDLVPRKMDRDWEAKYGLYQ
jgi:hypothetical protein